MYDDVGITFPIGSQTMKVDASAWDKCCLYKWNKNVSIVRPTRCTIFQSLLNITVHVSDGFSVHRQESKTVHTASGICPTGLLTTC
jgi:hypothetical protein